MEYGKEGFSIIIITSIMTRAMHEDIMFWSRE